MILSNFAENVLDDRVIGLQILTATNHASNIASVHYIRISLFKPESVHGLFEDSTCICALYLSLASELQLKLCLFEDLKTNNLIVERVFPQNIWKCRLEFFNDPVTIILLYSI